MNQTQRFTQTSRPDPCTFGGIIYPSDFDTEHSGKRNAGASPIASRIAGDQRFDLQCRRNREFADRRRQEKGEEREER